MTSQFFLTIAVLFAIVIIALPFAPRRRISVPGDMTVPLEGSDSIEVSLIRKGWGISSFKRVPGTITVRSTTTSHYTVSPQSKTTTAAALYAYFGIQPTSVGTASVQFWGTSAYGSHASIFSSGPWVKVTITA